MPSATHSKLWNPLWNLEIFIDSDLKSNSSPQIPAGRDQLHKCNAYTYMQWVQADCSILEFYQNKLGRLNRVSISVNQKQKMWL